MSILAPVSWTKFASDPLNVVVPDPERLGSRDATVPVDTRVNSVNFAKKDFITRTTEVPSPDASLAVAMVMLRLAMPNLENVLVRTTLPVTTANDVQRVTTEMLSKGRRRIVNLVLVLTEELVWRFRAIQTVQSVSNVPRVALARDASFAKMVTLAIPWVNQDLSENVADAIATTMWIPTRSETATEPLENVFGALTTRMDSTARGASPDSSETLLPSRNPENLQIANLVSVIRSEPTTIVKPFCQSAMDSTAIAVAKFTS
jgi:hypothetical protein